MDYLASMYIDNEMNLEEKKHFVKRIKKDHAFYLEALELLSMEQLLRQESVHEIGDAEEKGRLSIHFDPWYGSRKFGYIGAVPVIAIMILLPIARYPENQLAGMRFVLFEPEASSVELVGNFTDWHPMEMKRLGSSGYWEIRLRLSEGRHRYSYLIDSEKYIHDPTVLLSEGDDYGGQNSIIRIGERI